MKLSAAIAAPRCLLVALGGGEEPATMLPAAEHLSGTLELPLLEVEDPAEPERSLERLCGHSGGWLAPLHHDMGRPLPRGGCWAEALGAWRQPVAVAIPPAQLATGLPAAATALLRSWRVPLLGLVQSGGAWRPAERRRDGLPWLGSLGSEADPAPALLLQWHRLDLPASVLRGPSTGEVRRPS
jgi:hypothetical protein